MTIRAGEYADELLFLVATATAGALVWFADLDGVELGAYALVVALGIGLGALFVRAWLREWRRAGRARDRPDGTGTEK